MNDLTAVSLFAGIDGIGLALKRAGVKVKAAVEIDEACRGVIARHFPRTVLFNDVTEVTGDQLRAAGFVPGRGILAAGWPCQGNSIAGRRGGMADPRSGLWMHVARLLAELRPRWFIGENVPGLLSVNEGRDIAVVRRDLAQLGYWWAERVLDAQFFGVPQRRRRIFFVGCPGDPAGPVQVLLEPESSGGDLAPRPEPGTRIAGTLAASAGGGGLGGCGQSANAITGRLNETAGTLQGGGRRGYRIDAEGAASGHLIALPLDLRNAARSTEAGKTAGLGIGEVGDPCFTLSAAGRALPGVATFGSQGVRDALTAEGADASEDGTGRGTPIIVQAITAREGKGPDSNVTSGNLIAAGHVPMAFNPQTGGSRGRLGYAAKPTALQASQITAVHFAENQRGELVESPVHHQLSTGGGKVGQGYPAVHPDSRVRRLTPLECERLQGFPDGWTDGQSDAVRYRQLGNAVAVPVVYWIARRLVAADAALILPLAAASSSPTRTEGEVA